MLYHFQGRCDKFISNLRINNYNNLFAYIKDQVILTKLNLPSIALKNVFLMLYHYE